MARHDAISDRAPRPTRRIASPGLHDTPQSGLKLRWVRRTKRAARFRTVLLDPQLTPQRADLFAPERKVISLAPTKDGAAAARPGALGRALADRLSASGRGVKKLTPYACVESDCERTFRSCPPHA